MTDKKTSVPPEVVQFLHEHDTFYVVGHLEPDGDCVASAMALAGFLRRTLSKTSKLFNVGPFDRREIARFASDFRPRLPLNEREDDVDPAVVVLDCSGPERVGAVADDLEGLPVMVIDHHQTSRPYGTVQFVDTSAPATCYLVQLVMEEMGPDISEDEADCLLFGIATDTGYFRHVDADAAELFPAIARLMRVGASPKTTHQRMFGGQTMASRKLLALLIQRTQVLHDGAAVITWETMSDTAEHGRDNRDSDTLYELLFGVEGLRMIALIREESATRCSGSLRSIDTIDVSKIATTFGGGGHKRAAGFRVDLPLVDLRAQLEEAILAAFGDE